MLDVPKLEEAALESLLEGESVTPRVVARITNVAAPHTITTLAVRLSLESMILYIVRLYGMTVFLLKSNNGGMLAIRFRK